MTNEWIRSRSSRSDALVVGGGSGPWRRRPGRLFFCPAVVCPVGSLWIHQTPDWINQSKQSHQKGERGSDKVDLHKAYPRHDSLRMSRTGVSIKQKHTLATLLSIPEVNDIILSILSIIIIIIKKRVYFDYNL